MPIVRVNNKGKKRKTAKIVASIVASAVAASLISYFFFNKEVGLLCGFAASSFGSIWGLLDE